MKNKEHCPNVSHSIHCLLEKTWDCCSCVAPCQYKMLPVIHAITAWAQLCLLNFLIVLRMKKKRTLCWSSNPASWPIIECNRKFMSESCAVRGFLRVFDHLKSSSDKAQFGMVGGHVKRAQFHEGEGSMHHVTNLFVFFKKNKKTKTSAQSFRNLNHCFS